MYNDTNITNANNVIEIVKATNDLSGGLLISVFLIVIYIAFLAMYKKNDLRTAAVVTGFLMVIISILTFVFEWATLQQVSIAIIGFIVSFFVFMFAEDK